MGCTSSSPLITSAGSEMLKSVSREASDGAKNVAQDVAHATDQALDTAKESIGDVLTSVASDVGSAIGHSASQSENGQEILSKKLPLNEYQDTKGERKPEKKDTMVEQSMPSAIISEVRAKPTTTPTTTVSSLRSGQKCNDHEAESITGDGRTVPELFPLANSVETSIPESETDISLNKSVMNGQLMPLGNLRRETEAEMSSAQPQHQDQLKIVQRIDAASITSVEKVVEIVLEENKARNMKKIDDEYFKEIEEEKLKNDKESTTHETAKPHEIPSTSSTSSSSAPSSSVENACPSESQLIERPGTTEWEKHADMLSKQRRHNTGVVFRMKGNFKNSAEMQTKLFCERATQFNPMIDDITVSLLGQQQSDSDMSDCNKNINAVDNSLFNSNSSCEETGSDQSCHLLPSKLNPANVKHFQREFASLITCKPSVKSGQFVKTKSCASSRIPSRLSSPVNASNTERWKQRKPRLTRSSTTISLVGNPTNPNIISLHKPKTNPRENISYLIRSPTNFKRLHGVYRIKCSNQNTLRKVSSRPFIVGDGISPMKSQPQSNVFYPSLLSNTARQRSFSSKKNNHELGAQQLNPTFGPDLNSSMPRNRSRLSPSRSPYKISGLCSVCNNKFLI